VTVLAAAVGAAAALQLWFAGAPAPSSATPAVPAPAATSGGTPPSPAAGSVRAAAGAIEIAVAGTEADLARVRALVRPRRSSGAILRWRRLDSFRAPQILDAAPDHDPRAAATRCWIDLGNPRRAHLYFVGRSGARFLIRDVDLSGRFDELDLTSLAEVIDLSLAAVLENDRAGISRDEAERLLAPKPEAPAPAPAPPVAVLAAAPAAESSPPWSRGVRAGVFYAAETFAAALPLVSGPGVVVTAPVTGGVGGGWHLGAWASGQYQIPAEANGDLASVRLATIATRAGLSLLWPLGARRSSRFALEARAGGGIDKIHLTPQVGTRDGSAALTPARWSTSLALTAAAGAAVAFGDTDRVRLGARIYADLLPIATHYDVAVDGQPTIVVAPDRIRPGVVLDLTLALGAGRLP
jgi:hypothetical protein